MRTLKIRVDDSIYHNLLWFLKRFKKDEIEVVTEDNEFLSVQAYMEAELQKVAEGRAEYISLEEFDGESEKTIRSHED